MYARYVEEQWMVLRSTSVQLVVNAISKSIRSDIELFWQLRQSTIDLCVLAVEIR
jgi:hypothetical protein